MGKKQKKKIPLGWNTTDEQEIHRRVLRAQAEPMKITNLEPDVLFFSTYKVLSKTESYIVEIRSLSELINSCSCIDYEINGLGTCKHIEKVLLELKKGWKRKKTQFLKSQRFEIYVDPFDLKVKVKEPPNNNNSYEGFKEFFSASGVLLSDIKTALPSLLRLPKNSTVRISNRLKFLASIKTFDQKTAEKEFFLADVEKGKQTLDIMKKPLYEYQKQGMLHLAFTEKAILADDMGLGKTAQAIAAAELLRRIRGVQKVLVITLPSLKGEWEDQIKLFVDHKILPIYGNRGERLKHYRREAFFYIASYEQVVRDREDIQRILSPDIIILDEAQRIKNWKTKTASTLKLIDSPYAFVLTGTPIENRIDDIYSIVQFLYPHLLGSLFRFNREFYQLDAKGKAVGYKNLHILHQRLKLILLRRLKKDVEDQLPPRTIKTYFVQMSSEQQKRYEDQEWIVRRLGNLAEKRPLSEKELKELQATLARMRMICDTPYILDEDSRVCPKLRELKRILEDLEEDAKVIIFSEWERMLFLVRDLLEHKKIDYAWHTGSVDQKKRRDVIQHFREDPKCRVFLSTDSGGVGLNLQKAHVVINLDLPWNPAKIEQRIARAWRKNQTKKVQVINLVSENTIEHRMLGVLKLKQSLSHTVLDSGDIDQMVLPSGRKALMEQLMQIIGPSYHWEEETSILKFQQDVLARLKPRIHHLESFKVDNHKEAVLAVVNGDISQPEKEMKELLHSKDTLEVIDRKTFETLKRLSKAGIVSFNQSIPFYSSEKPLHQDEKKGKLIQKYNATRKRKEQLAALLIKEGFLEEVPIKEIFELAIKSFAVRTAQEDIGELKDLYGLPKEALSLATDIKNPTLDVCDIFKRLKMMTQFLDNAE